MNQKSVPKGIPFRFKAVENRSKLRMDIRKLLGANLRRYRLSADLSQEAVANRMGVDRAYISAVEPGMQNVTLLILWEIAQALGVRPTDLLNENIPPSDED